MLDALLFGGAAGTLGPLRRAVGRARTSGSEQPEHDAMNNTPTRATFLPFSRPSIGEQEIAGVVEVLRSG